MGATSFAGPPGEAGIGAPDYLFPGQAPSAPVVRAQGKPVPQAHVVQRLSRWPFVFEVGLTATGIFLAGFMLMHMSLLSTVLSGKPTMNALARFLERYYLLHAAVPFLVAAFVIHIVTALRKVPGNVREQRSIWRATSGMGHLDTWTWYIQIFTALAVAVMASMHLWVILNNLPIGANKSGARVFQSYLWFYVPFVIFIEAHISVGLYRIAVKWHLIPRKYAHKVLMLWTVGFVGLGAAILAVFYRIGGSL